MTGREKGFRRNCMRWPVPPKHSPCVGHLVDFRSALERVGWAAPAERPVLLEVQSWDGKLGKDLDRQRVGNATPRKFRTRWWPARRARSDAPYHAGHARCAAKSGQKRVGVHGLQLEAAERFIDGIVVIPAGTVVVTVALPFARLHQDGEGFHIAVNAA